MELVLQMGHGMQSMCEKLFKYWGTGTAILSPVNLERKKLADLARRYHAANGKVLFDPQLYYPKDGADKLQRYDYWPGANMSITDSLTHQNICRDILEINQETGADGIILPGIEMDIDQFEYGLTWISDSTHYFRDHIDKELYATICLYTEVLRSQQAVEDLVNALDKLDVDGFYIVARSSNEEYIISDPRWMIGLVKLVACLKFMHKKVILAYTNHQGLIASLAHVDAIASGNYMNTRQFVSDRFRSKKADLDRRKSVWYFHPYAISEYKAELLDIAYTRGYLNSFKPLGDFVNPYSDMLFTGAMPSSTSYNETTSFMHYLHCLKTLCSTLTLESYEEVKARYNFLIDTSENIMHQYKAKGFRSQNRDFGIGIESLRIAVAALDEDYGFRLGLDWKNL